MSPNTKSSPEAVSYTLDTIMVLSRRQWRGQRDALGEHIGNVKHSFVSEKAGCLLPTIPKALLGTRFVVGVSVLPGSHNH